MELPQTILELEVLKWDMAVLMLFMTEQEFNYTADPDFRKFNAHGRHPHPLETLEIPAPVLQYVRMRHVCGMYHTVMLILHAP